MHFCVTLVGKAGLGKWFCPNGPLLLRNSASPPRMRRETENTDC